MRDMTSPKMTDERCPPPLIGHFCSNGYEIYIVTNPEQQLPNQQLLARERVWHEQNREQLMHLGIYEAIDESNWHDMYVRLLKASDDCKNSAETNRHSDFPEYAPLADKFEHAGISAAELAIDLAVRHFSSWREREEPAKKLPVDTYEEMWLTPDLAYDMNTASLAEWPNLLIRLSLAVKHLRENSYAHYRRGNIKLALQGERKAAEITDMIDRRSFTVYIIAGHMVNIWSGQKSEDRIKFPKRVYY